MTFSYPPPPPKAPGLPPTTQPGWAAQADTTLRRGRIILSVWWHATILLSFVLAFTAHGLFVLYVFVCVPAIVLSEVVFIAARAAVATSARASAASPGES